MSAPSPTEAAIHAIDACEELTKQEKLSARVLVMNETNVNVAQGITATKAAERAETIRQLLLDRMTRTAGDDRRRRSGGESSEGSEHPKPEGEESARKRIKIQHAKLKPKHDVGSFEVFWQELVTCKKQQLDDTPSCLLTLQNGAYIFGQIGAGSDLFIRECYVQIYDSVIAEMQVIEAKGTSVNKANAFGVLIVGTPGIGKSLFLCYAMWRLAQDYPQSNIVYFNYFEQRYYLLLADGTSDSVVDPDHLQSLLRNPDTFLLFDAAGKEHPPIVNARTIVVSSPDERQYKQWQKARKLCRYMPAWTLDEIMLAHKHIPLYGLVTDVEERFRIVGGVPRFVLDNTVALKKIKFDAAAWINACDLDAVLSAINGGFAGGGGEQVVTAKLINLVANSPAYDELLRVEWMSSYIASGVVAHYFKDHQAKVVSFLRAASESDRLGGIFGDAFEPYAHLRLAEGGVFNVRPLGAPSTGQQIELQPTEVAWFHDASEFAKFDDKLYGRPVSDSFPTIDSAIQPNSVFQITTSLTHDLKLAGLIEIIAALKDTNLHHFYVAVPEMFFHKFTTTPIKPPNGEMPKTVQQYVLALPLPTVHSHPLESLESGVRHRLLRDGFDVTVCDSILNTVRSETERQYLRDHGFKVTDAKGKHSTWTAIGGEIHSKTHIITLFKTRHGEITAIIKQKPDHAAAAAAVTQ